MKKQAIYIPDPLPDDPAMVFQVQFVRAYGREKCQQMLRDLRKLNKFDNKEDYDVLEKELEEVLQIAGL